MLKEYSALDIIDYHDMLVRLKVALLGNSVGNSSLALHG